MEYKQQRHFQQMLRRDFLVTTRKFLLPLFCISVSYLSHSDCLFVILKFYTVPMFLHTVTNLINQKAFSSKHVSPYLPRTYDVISQLHHNYCKGPFCMARLISFSPATVYANQKEGFSVNVIK